MNFENTKLYLKKTGFVRNINKLKKKKATQIKQYLFDYIHKIKNNSFTNKTYEILNISNNNNSSINLTKEQTQIITSEINCNYKIIACAGSGKTTTIIARIKYLIEHNIPPSSIMITTFNVDACESIKKKLYQVFGFDINITLGTLDSIAYRFCKMYLNKEDFYGVSELCTIFLEFLQSSHEKAKYIKNKYQYIFFDEFQDCNNVQFEILKEFSNKSFLSVIGDDAQNIYQWRGSNIDYIMNFEKLINFDSFKIHTLSNNFRSTPEIINMSNNSIINNSDVIPKKMIPNNKSINYKPYIEKYNSEQEQAIIIVQNIYEYIYGTNKILPEEIAILSRNNYSIKYVEEELEKHNLKKLQKINYVSLITDDTKDTKPKIQNNHITLTTIHKSKGLEFQLVYIISCNDDKFPSETSKIKIEEDRRLFYVAITRAKQYLKLSFTNNTITRFIGEIKSELYNFPAYHDKYFNYKNDRTLKFKNGVCSLIEMLEPRHIKEMRELEIIPKIKPQTKKIHPSHTYSKEITIYYLQPDYGIFIDKYIQREIDVKFIDTNYDNKIKDSISDRVLNSVQLEGKYYAMYMKYNHNIQSKIDNLINFDVPIENYEKNKNKIINFLNRNYDDKKYIKTIETSDIFILSSLIMKLIKKSLLMKIYPSQLFVSPFNYIPHDFQKRFLISQKNYKSNKPSNKIIKDVFNISLCQNIYEGRRRLIYKDCFDYFYTDNKLFHNINNWIDSMSSRKLITKMNVHDKLLSIYGEIDLIDLTPNDNILIDFKCSKNSSCNLEWIIQLMMYSALYKKNHNIIINKLQIYNPLRGELTTIDLVNYDKHEQLLQYIDDVRTQKML
jgi:hypothetical protein